MPLPTAPARLGWLEHWRAVRSFYCDFGPPSPISRRAPASSKLLSRLLLFLTQCTGILTSRHTQAGELLPADMILYCADHVILFAGWANGDHTAFYGMLPECDLASL